MKLNRWVRYKGLEDRHIEKVKDNMATRARVILVAFIIPFVGVNGAIGLTLMTLPHEMVAPWTFKAGVLIFVIGVGAFPYWFFMITFVEMAIIGCTRSVFYWRRIYRCYIRPLFFWK